MEERPQKGLTLAAAWDLLREARVGEFGAQAAFFILLSLLPFLVFLTALLSFLPWDSSLLARWLPQELLAALPSRPPSAAVLSLSGGTALWSASRGIVALTRGLNRMYGCEETRSYLRLRFFALAQTLILELSLLCTLGGVVQGEALVHLFGLRVLPPFVGVVLGWGILSLFFLFLYALLPNRSAPLFRQLPGAAGAALGWILFTEGFSFYVTYVADFSLLYGALSNVAMLILWLWLCLCILFLGAFVNRLLTLV